MKKNLIYALVVVFFTGTVSLPGMAKANVTGNWEITSQGPRGESIQVVEMKQEGDQLTVIMTDEDDQTLEAYGTVEGDNIEWTLIQENPGGGEFIMIYTGTVEGDTMSGELQIGDFDSGEWTAKRVKEE